LGHDPSVKTIAHEVFHVVWRIMAHIGATHENEVMAYHVGYLVHAITENLYKYAPAYEEVRQLNKRTDQGKKKKLTARRKKSKV
jgi:accessory gene regulator protein AgrB